MTIAMGSTGMFGWWDGPPIFVILPSMVPLGQTLSLLEVLLTPLMAPYGVTIVTTTEVGAVGGRFGVDETLWVQIQPILNAHLVL